MFRQFVKIISNPRIFCYFNLHPFPSLVLNFFDNCWGKASYALMRFIVKTRAIREDSGLRREKIGPKAVSDDYYRIWYALFLSLRFGGARIASDGVVGRPLKLATVTYWIARVGSPKIQFLPYPSRNSQSCCPGKINWRVTKRCIINSDVYVYIALVKERVHGTLDAAAGLTDEG